MHLAKLFLQIMQKTDLAFIACSQGETMKVQCDQMLIVTCWIMRAFAFRSVKTCITVMQILSYINDEQGSDVNIKQKTCWIMIFIFQHVTVLNHLVIATDCTYINKAEQSREAQVFIIPPQLTFLLSTQFSHMVCIESACHIKCGIFVYLSHSAYSTFPCIHFHQATFTKR